MRFPSCLAFFLSLSIMKIGFRLAYEMLSLTSIVLVTYLSSIVYKSLDLNVSVISKMARIAVYGSSHVKRLAQYFKTRPFLFRLKYFCRGGMRADEVDNQSW